MKLKSQLKLLFLLPLTGICLTGCSPEMVLKMKGYKSNFKEGTSYSNDGGEFYTASKSQQNSEDGPEGILGYAFGAGGEWQWDEHFSYESALLYARKGAKNENSFGGGFKRVTSLQYIDAPQTVSYEIGTTGIRILAGLQPSILLKAKEKTEFQDDEVEMTITDNYKTFDLAGVVGAGYQLNRNWRVNLGYDHGFINVREDNEFGGFEQRNRALWLGVTYRFREKDMKDSEN